MEKRSDNPQGSESIKIASKMPNLRTSGCGELATTRIEIFSPIDGRAHGRLDGAMYLCDRHSVDFAEVAVGEVTIYRTPLAVQHGNILCGHGWDFVAGKGIGLDEESTDVFGDDHPVIEEAILHICNEDLGLLPYTRRQFAARMLGEWEHEASLTDREREVILSRFPETVDREALARIADDEEPATCAADKKTARGLRATMIVFRLGWRIGRGLKKTDYQRAVDLAVRILEERQAAKGADE